MYNMACNTHVETFFFGLEKKFLFILDGIMRTPQ